MRWLRQRFSPWHAWTALALWVAFGSLTLCILASELDHARHRPWTLAMTTVGTALGPMTGAISRNFQVCCLRFSLSLLPYCLAGPALGVLVQLLTPRRPVWLASIRPVAWMAGWLVWFGGGIVSFGHALE